MQLCDRPVVGLFHPDGLLQGIVLCNLQELCRERPDVDAARRGDAHGGIIRLGQGGEHGTVAEPVDFVEYRDRRLVGSFQFFQRRLYYPDLFLIPRMADVDDMEENIRFDRLRERALERGDQVGRQFPDETDRVGKENPLCRRQGNVAHRRVERCE